MRRSHVTTVSLLVALALAACTNAKDVLEPSAITPPATSAPAAQGSAARSAAHQRVPATTTGAAATTTPPLTSAQAAAILSKTRLQIAPIVGASVEAATPLTAELQTRAKQRGITLAGSADQTATHVLKGYFSAILGRQGHHRHLCLGRLRPGRQPPAPHQRPDEGAFRQFRRRRRQLEGGLAGHHAGDRRPDHRPVRGISRRQGGLARRAATVAFRRCANTFLEFSRRIPDLGACNTGAGR